MGITLSVPGVAHHKQVVESSTAVTSTLLGDKLQVAADMDTYSRRVPLGVCAAITPFNFPAMFVCCSWASDSR